MKGDALKLAQLSAQIQTVGAAKGVLDVATSQLAVGAQGVALVPASYAANPVAAGFAFLLGQTGDVTSQLTDEITQAQGEVDKYQAIFRGYVGDDLQQEISTAHSMGIASTCQYVNKVLNHVVDALGDRPEISGIDFVNAVAQVLQTVSTATAAAASSVLQGAANVAAGVASAFWVPLVVVGGGVLLVVAYQKGWLGKAVPA